MRTDQGSHNLRESVTNAPGHGGFGEAISPKMGAETTEPRRVFGDPQQGSRPATSWMRGSASRG